MIPGQTNGKNKREHGNNKYVTNCPDSKECIALVCVPDIEQCMQFVTQITSLAGSAT